MGKVRIYELAKELKLENRKVLEDARRMGVDVSVPSNTLDENIAEKIRETYYPKKEPTNLQHKARLVKRPSGPLPGLETVVTGALAPHEVDDVPAVEVSRSSSQAAPAVQPQTEPIRARIVKLVPQPPAPVVETAATTAPLEPVEPFVEAPEVQEEPAAAATAASELALETPEQIDDAPAAASPVPTTAPLPVTPPVKPPITPPVRAHESRGAGTSVIRLATRPPAPKPVVTPPAAGATARTTANLEQRIARGATRTEGAKGGPEHLLPSGATQKTIYIPPKDTRHRGRHSTRPRGAQGGDKQEGHQLKISTRRPTPVIQPKVRAIPTELKPIRVVEGVTVRGFADKLEVKPKDVVSILLERGIMATMNQTLTPDVAQEIGRSFGFDVSIGAFEDMTIESEFEITPEAMEDTDARAPVITVMGHVDHGKTSLLDAIRQARVAEGEAGGITQHIGAYAVDVANPDKPSEKRRIVFLDTPGHEAFTLMRARGARVTDVVVLVVAADDGVMPQTVEAIEHARAANVPIVVAINKIDKPDANPERVKKELADRGLLWDSWGGTTTMVEVSAKKHQNIDSLLELIILTADILDLKANPKRLATGTVLEAKLDRGRGPVATLLIQNGSLHTHDPFIVGNYFGRVRALIDDRGNQIAEAGPSTPVEVLGLQGVPAAGDQFQAVTDIAKAQQISSYRQSQARILALARTAARGLDQLHAQMEAGEVKELLVILKADVQGSVEVLKDTLTKLSTDKVKVRIIRSGVGAITESDVLLASASNATTEGAATVIIGFNVRPETRAEEVARQENIDVRLHSVIYKVEEEIRAAMIGMLDATIKETVIGKAEIRDVIRVPRIGNIAGCIVTNGTIKRTARGRLIRDNVVIFDNAIGSLRRFKDDVSEVAQNFECGVTIERFNDYKVGDVIEAYTTEKVAATQL